MEIILLQDVDKVGLRGEVVSVARGFARNYLPVSYTHLTLPTNREV